MSNLLLIQHISRQLRKYYLRRLIRKNPNTRTVGKNVAYVGGYGGIGHACCKEMICKGIRCLTILDLKENAAKHQELQLLNSKLKLYFIPLNLCDGKESIASALNVVIQHMGQIDVLVNGSGIANDRQPKLTIDINLTGLIETTLAAIPLMSRANGHNGGLIVNVASVLGLEPGAFLAVYTATKHGIIGFTRACADEHYYQHTGIAHMAICPGATVTGILDSFVGVDTFEFSKPISEKFIKAKNQTTDECAKPMVNVIENAENGCIWIVDLGKLQKVKMHKYWEYQFD